MQEGEIPFQRRILAQSGGGRNPVSIPCWANLSGVISPSLGLQFRPKGFSQQQAI